MALAQEQAAMLGAAGILLLIYVKRSLGMFTAIAAAPTVALRLFAIMRIH